MRSATRAGVSASAGGLLVAVADTGSRTASLVVEPPCFAIPGNCPSALRSRIHGSGTWPSVTSVPLDIRIAAGDLRLIEDGLALGTMQSMRPHLGVTADTPVSRATR